MSCQRNAGVREVERCSLLHGGARPLGYVQERLCCCSFPFPEPLRHRSVCSSPPSLPPVPVLPSGNHSAGVSAPQQVGMQSSSCDGVKWVILLPYHTAKFVFLLCDIRRHITGRGIRMSFSPLPLSKGSDGLKLSISGT